MKSATQAKLLLGVIMAMAFLSYLTITTSTSNAARVVIYEMEASRLADDLWSPAKPYDASADLKTLRHRRPRAAVL